jgi:hypothetical protein
MYRCCALFLAVLIFETWCCHVPCHQRLLATSPSNQEHSQLAMRMRLQNQSVCFGEVVACSRPGLIAWRNQGFDEPFLFEPGNIRSINRIRAVRTQDGAMQDSTFRVKTVTGDVFAGTAIRLDDEQLTILSPVLGQIEIRRDQVLCLVKAGPTGEVVYPGLVESQVWKPLSKAEDWDAKGGVLTALRQGASILGDLSLPDKCEISISLAWKGVPDFVLSLGTDSLQQRRGPVAASARIEVWNRNVVLVRETRRIADLHRLADLNPSVNQIDMTILLDQSQGLASVLDTSGKTLGKLVIQPEEATIEPAIRIDNHGPSLIVERLEVRRWDGISFLESDLTDCLIRSNGEIMPGTVLAIDQESGLVRHKSPSGELENVAIGQVAFIGMDARVITPSDSFPAVASADGKAEVEIVLADSSRLVGQWLPSEDSVLRILSHHWNRTFEFSPLDLTGITPMEGRSIALSTENRNGVLIIGDSQIAGVLDEPTPDGPGTPLRWKPHGSVTSSPLPQSVAGSILYRHHQAAIGPRPAVGLASDTNVFDTNVNAVEVDKLNGHSDQSPAPASYSGWPITFISGDTIDGEIIKIDQRGVHLKSSDSPIRFVEQHKLDNVWLNALNSGVKPSMQSKVDRLMKIPRMMKDDPPTHLLLAIDGDFLRCRLIKLDTTQALIEVRGEIVRMERKQIAQIFWLHQRDWIVGKGSDESSAPKDFEPLESRIHVMLSNRGITLIPTELRSGFLAGESELLGACRIALREIRQILFGPQLDARIAEFRENPWILTLTPGPKASIENN